MWIDDEFISEMIDICIRNNEDNNKIQRINKIIEIIV